MEWRFLILLMLGLAITGCTQKNLYHSIQEHHRNQCKMEPPPLDQECLEALTKSHEDYLEEREEVLRDE
jgi:hypothetical protein